MPQQEHEQLITALCECASVCEQCAYDVCLGEPKMKDCGQACIDCAQTCWTTAAFVSRGSPFMSSQVAACEEICQVCAAKCQQYPRSQQMCQCAEACQKAAQACRACLQECAAPPARQPSAAVPSR